MRASQIKSKAEDFSRENELRLNKIREQYKKLGTLEAHHAAQLDAAFKALAGELIDSGANTGLNVEDQLQLRAQEEAHLKTALQDAEQKVDGLVQQKRILQDEIDSFRHRKIDSVLAADQAYQALLSRVSEATANVHTAQANYTEIQSECERKIPAYDNHAIFDYLIKTGYATPQYRRRPIIATLDRWLAGLCNFSQNQSNLAILKEMATRNQEDWAALNEALQSDERAAQAYRQEIEAKSGIDALTTKLDALQAEIDARKRQCNKMHDLLDQYMHRTDERFVKIQDRLARYLKSDTIDDLLEIARKTQGTADDALVQEVQALREKLNDVQKEKDRALVEFERAKEQYERAKELERHIRSSSQVSSSREYSGFDFTDLAAAYMIGRINLNDVSSEIYRHSSAIESNHDPFSTRSSSSFSSGGGDFFSSSSSDSSSFSTSDSF